MPRLTTEEQQKSAQQRAAQTVTYSRAEAQKKIAETTQPAAPLPVSYWQLGAQVPGAQPYVSGKVSEPAYVAPPGYTIVETKQTPEGLEVTLKPTEAQQKGIQLFGIKEWGTMETYYRYEDGKLVYTSPFYSGPVYRLVEGKPQYAGEVVAGQPSKVEMEALLGLGLVTVTAPAVAIPQLAIASGVGLGVAEATKVTITGEHLTLPEAIGVASISQAAYVTASHFAPYAKEAYHGLVERLSPERAMYQRVVASQQDITAPVGTKSWLERISTKAFPERAMYQRVTKQPSITPPPATKTTTEFLTGGKGAAQQWVVQETLVKQVPVQKAPMKPFLPVVTAPTLKTITVTPSQQVAKTVSKAQAKAVAKATAQQREMVQTVQQQIVHPFLQFPGKPYFRKAEKEWWELQYYTYPIASPLEQPKIIAVPTTLARTTPIEKLMPSQRFIQKQVPMQVQIPGLAQLSQQAQKQVQEQVQQQKQIQQQIQEQMQTQTTRMQREWFTLGGGFDTGGFLREMSRRTGLWGRYPRVYPVVTGAQFLEMEYGKKRKRKK